MSDTAGGKETGSPRRPGRPGLGGRQKREFGGFPAGATKSTPIPNAFFTDLLPTLDDLAELKTTLHIFWALYQKRGSPRYLSRRELEGNGVLLESLGFGGRPAEELLHEALRQAVVRGTLLKLTMELHGVAEELYFLNMAEGRQAVAKLRSGELDVGQVVLPEEGEVAVPRAERPNIFVLYEENIGLLTPLIAEELAEAEKLYPADWIEAAFREAVEYNKRNWRYVRRILERWATEGRKR